MPNWVLLCVALTCVACGMERNRAAVAVTGGEPASGSAAIVRYGCGSCHTIPNIAGANGRVGPSLASLRLRTYIAGELPNNADNLTRWIQHPLSVRQSTAMPELNVSARDSRDIAAFLYSLK